MKKKFALYPTCYHALFGAGLVVHQRPAEGSGKTVAVCLFENGQSPRVILSEYVLIFPELCRIATLHERKAMRKTFLDAPEQDEVKVPEMDELSGPQEEFEYEVAI